MTNHGINYFNKSFVAGLFGFEIDMLVTFYTMKKKKSSIPNPDCDVIRLAKPSCIRIKNS